MTLERLVSSTRRSGPEVTQERALAASVPAEHGAVGQLSGDEELQQAVCAQLLRTPGLDARDIQVAVLAHGEVTLLGKVATSHQRNLALRVARELAGGRAVRADLQLEPEPR